LFRLRVYERGSNRGQLIACGLLDCAPPLRHFKRPGASAPLRLQLCDKRVFLVLGELAR
jgi:hypothetical protein